MYHCAFCQTLRAASAAASHHDHAPHNPGRRLFTGALLAGAMGSAFAREGVEVDRQSSLAKLVPAEQIETAAGQEYGQMIAQARAKNQLAPSDHPQTVRLREVAKRIIPFSDMWNARAKQWKWEVNLIDSKELNAFCMPGGKIAFFSGILRQLRLNDDEVAMIMGHEAAHALREHARERIGKTMATRGGIEVLSAIFGLGNVGRTVADIGGQLLTLKFSRSDESEADLVGMELAARAGYNPRAGVTLWEKMGEAAKGAPPEFISTHPSGPSRIKDIQANLPRVQPLYDRAPRPARRFPEMA